MNPNPPIKGHTLQLEGGWSNRYRLKANGRFGWVEVYGCECGAHPEPRPGASATKRWHRQHKADLRRDAQIGVDIVALADEFSPWSFTEHEATP